MLNKTPRNWGWNALCYQCVIASGASQPTELGSVYVSVCECVNTYLVIPPYFYIFKIQLFFFYFF